MTTLGGSCSNRSGGIGGNRTFLTPYTFTEAGIVTSVCMYASKVIRDANICAIFYRPNGGNWDYVGESDTQIITSATPQSYTIACSVEVHSGDRIGFYTSGDAVVESTSSEAQIVDYIEGKETGTGISFPNHFHHDGISVLATYSTGLLNVYVDINKTDDTLDGSSWTNAKKTLLAGYNMLISTGTIHVATGDYSGQTGITYNKHWFLSPEDPNSTGVKNVKIPPSV